MTASAPRGLLETTPGDVTTRVRWSAAAPNNRFFGGRKKRLILMNVDRLLRLDAESLAPGEPGDEVAEFLVGLDQDLCR